MDVQHIHYQEHRVGDTTVTTTMRKLTNTREGGTKYSASIHRRGKIKTVWRDTKSEADQWITEQTRLYTETRR